MKILNIILAIMFVGFAALQLNDPDPFVWILIYFTMTVACTMAAFNKYNRPLMAVQATVYIIYIALLWTGVVEWLRSPDRSLLFDDLAKMQYPYIEETREVLGLLICLAVLGMLWVRSKKVVGPRRY
jgi:hypothetical protein